MRLLLDTHVFLWCVKDDRRLTKAAREILAGATEVYVSSASIWEAAIKAKLGKLEANVDALVSSIADSGFLELPITAKHAAALGRLPDVHNEPFDRMLIAQAISEPLRFLTADDALGQYSELVEPI